MAKWIPLKGISWKIQSAILSLSVSQLFEEQDLSLPSVQGEEQLL